MFELDYDSKYISIILEFEYDSKDKKKKYRTNDFREAFLGLSPPEYPNARGSPNIPKTIRELFKYEREIIYPIHWALIKKPVKVDMPDKKDNYIIRNTAVGAIILYEYLGLLEDYRKCCLELEKFITKKKTDGKPVHFKSLKDFKIIIGYDLKDVRE
jgi:hypothetical protein